MNHNEKCILAYFLKQKIKTENDITVITDFNPSRMHGIVRLICLEVNLGA